MQSVPLDKPKLSSKAQVKKKCLSLLWTSLTRENKYLSHCTTTLLPADITCLSWANCEKSLQIHEQVHLVKVCGEKVSHSYEDKPHRIYQATILTYLQRTNHHWWWQPATHLKPRSLWRLMNPCSLWPKQDLPAVEIRYDPSYDFFFW